MAHDEINVLTPMMGHTPCRVTIDVQSPKNCDMMP